MPKLKQETYFDYKELAEFLKLKVGTIRNWKSQGKLTYTTFNGKILFPKNEILKDLKRNQVRCVNRMLRDIIEESEIRAC